MVLALMIFQHSVIKYHNWNDFQERLDKLEEEKARLGQAAREARADGLDRKSTRLNSSHS
jgi:uncharacterized protein (UPF0335 family)